MTDEKLRKANELRKQIDSVKDKLDILPQFLKKPLITDVRITTTQNATLVHILDREELENLIIYLELKYKSKLELLEEQFSEL